jgi:ABC-type branched-subunit amino acid transport system ATPase component
VRFGGLIALDQVTVDVQPGIVTAFIGPNGAGKSTLLNAVSGFQLISDGDVFLGDKRITHIPAHARIALGMARTFQDNEVLPRLTVLENTILGLQNQLGENVLRLVLNPRRVRAQKSASIETALSILDSVGLKDLANSIAGGLSYGQQKLLVLARLLATDASLFMLDEPGAGLSSRYIDQVGDILRKMVSYGKTVVLVDHNMRLVMNYAQFVVVLHHGQLIASGSPAEIKRNPDVLKVYLTRQGSN